MAMTGVDAVTTRLLTGYDDPSFGRGEWNALAERCPLPTCYQTWEFQCAWWETLGRGRLLLAVAERDGEVVAVAPCFADGSTIYFVGGRHEADYLDFVGDVSDPDVLDALVQALWAEVPGCSGFQLDFLPQATRTAARLATAAERLGLRFYDDWELPAPMIDLVGKPDLARELANKSDAVGRERYLRNHGSLEVRHFSDGEEILSQLEEFFEQHVGRRADMAEPSMFLDARRRAFVTRLTELAAGAGWLRFTRIDWDGRPIAFHHGTCYDGRYLVGIRSWDIDLARRSPGHVLFRNLLLAAIEEGAEIFDMGIGEQPHKLRYATDFPLVQAYGLYPRRDDG